METIEIIVKHWWEVILVLAAFAVAVIAILIAISRAVKKMGLRVKKDGVVIGDEEAQGESPPTQTPAQTPAISPHSKCIYAKDIIMVLTEQAEMITKVHDLEATILPDQMRYLENKILDIRGMGQSGFLSVLGDKFRAGQLSDNNFVENRDYKYYQLCIKCLAADLKEVIRTRYLENHYAQKTESEFREYAETNADALIRKITNALDDMYHGSIVSRTDLYESNVKIKQDAKDAIIDCFWYARSVTVKISEQSESLKAEFERYLETVIGPRATQQ